MLKQFIDLQNKNYHNEKLRFVKKENSQLSCENMTTSECLLTNT